MKTSIIVLALTFVASAQACLQTCTYSKQDSKTCYYTCTQACQSIPATEAATSFLGALNAKGYGCDKSGSTGVRCPKTSNLGACTGHYWTCGSGC
ncbi:hypothetical protein BGZ83_001702 [Gryganskiella cystojenkinii]|nr:hypothetical protein BGZ83_001702 [Gryganskiella cystojenkinii]